MPGARARAERQFAAIDVVRQQVGPGDSIGPDFKGGIHPHRQAREGQHGQAIRGNLDFRANRGVEQFVNQGSAKLRLNRMANGEDIDHPLVVGLVVHSNLRQGIGSSAAEVVKGQAIVRI